MSEYLNGTCAVCGKKYHVCDSCQEIMQFTPWRTIVDTAEHMSVHLVIQDYTNKYLTKAQAREQLSRINLADLDTFLPDIKLVIEDILTEPHVEITKNKSNITKKLNVSTTNDE